MERWRLVTSDMLQANIKQGILFTGAILPLGTAKAIVDVDLKNQGRFTSSIGSITGFLHMHDSGTGGFPSPGMHDADPSQSGGSSRKARREHDSRRREQLGCIPFVLSTVRRRLQHSPFVLLQCNTSGFWFHFVPSTVLQPEVLTNNPSVLKLTGI